MANVWGNEDLACYFTTKHSWRGKYKRIFSVGTKAITTYNPSNLEVTNQWAYSDFLSVAPSVKAYNELIITMKKGTGGKKTHSMTFSTEHRADLITETLRFQHNFSDYKSSNEVKFNAYKYHWSDNRLPVVLVVTSCSLDQVDTHTQTKLCSYDYKDIEGVALVSDYPGGFVILYGGFSRLHMFATEKRDELIRKMSEFSMACVGVALKLRPKPIKFEQYHKHRFGKYSEDEHVTSLAEFKVHKITVRSPDPVARTLCLSETCIIERDPATYCIATCQPLCDVFTIIRSIENPQLLSIEYVRGAIKTYTSTDRDSLLASLLDGVRASGNRDVCVKMTHTKRGLRLGPYISPVDEEVESHHLRFLAVPPGTFAEAVDRFNCNIHYNGLLHAVSQDGFFAENKERLITGAISALIDKEGDQNTVSFEELEAQFHAIRRLVASKAGFDCFTTLPKFRDKLGVKVVKALKRNDDGVNHAAIDMLCALMQPMHDNYDLRQEQLNKSSLLSSRKFLATILEIFSTHVNRSTGALVIAALLDFLTFALCPPYSETTEGNQFDTLLEMVADLGRKIFKLFQHPSMAIVKGAGMVMKAVIEPLGLLNYLESEDKVPESEIDKLRVRDNVKLAEDSSKSKKPLYVLYCIIMIDFVTWCQDSSKSKKPLYLAQLDAAMTHWRTKIGLKSKDVSHFVRSLSSQVLSSGLVLLPIPIVLQDINNKENIFSKMTREELREALESEMRAFTMDKDLGANFTMSWNHQEFEVHYECLNEEIKIGDYYLRLLLEDEEENVIISNSLEFFNDLYHRFLLTTKPNMKAMCLQAMTKVYSKCYQEIGSFNDTRYIIGMLEKASDKLERDRLLMFVNALIKHKRNVKEILDVNGVRVLVDLITLAHLHTTRAKVPLQTVMIEASADTLFDGEREWYYGNKEKERLGPFNFPEMKQLWGEGTLRPETKCWAQGMDGWRPLLTIPQLKWYLVASGSAVLNESDLCVLVLNMLIRMSEFYPNRYCWDSDGAIVRPLPRVKRMLSDATCLPHAVQLLLTFDPIIVEKVSILLIEVMVDNPILPRLYLTGVFFFIMMYTGSNVIPIVRFLQETHIKQAFRADESEKPELVQRSILGNILPEAMVCYLENYGPEKFAEIFLGEFDSPEAIWNGEMRRMMIEKIAAHLADFSPRLCSNTRALYQYCPIPVISYPQLEDELFCNIYYLRHLCNTEKFPDWPIKDPIRLLKDILEAWKKEVEKKPPNLSLDEAYETLRLKKDASGVVDEAKLRKAYFKLAQKYHPDKNPEGRDIFEKVNKAYEFLCSKSSRRVHGPDPQNIVLILKAQSILFKRYQDELQPYKYSGYPMLVKTIRMETKDSGLFSKSAPLLTAASELAYHTINCSALNAEELRRENGLEALVEAYVRCIDVITSSTTQDAIQVQVCTHITKCFAVAAQFESCREKITEMPIIINDLCRVLYFKVSSIALSNVSMSSVCPSHTLFLVFQNLPLMCSVAAECVSAFSVDFWLQTQMLQAGALWHLLLYLFKYDYTLEESGIDKKAESNQQEVANNLARLSMNALARLGGYLPDENTTPENPAIRKSLSAMLTPYLARQLSNDTPKELLKVLNSNTENPYLMWDNGTRAELTDFLEKQQHSNIIGTSGDASFGAEFMFDIHTRELIVGEIFVRIYNEQPTFALEAPQKFVVDLVNYLGSEAQYLHSLMALTASELDAKANKERLSHAGMALEALRNVIKNNPGTESQCIGHFKLIFSLLRMTSATKLQQYALENSDGYNFTMVFGVLLNWVISSVTANKNCVDSIADSEILGFLLLTLHTLPPSRLLCVDTLHALCSNTKIVKEAMYKGALIYLLDLFSNGSNPTVRERSVELFSKMMSDKLIGPRVKIILAKFLPSIFMDAMRDNAEASVHMFEAIHENPELIWNNEAREKVCSVVKDLEDKHYHQQRQNLDIQWKLPDDFSVRFSETEGELTIGGVYIRLFIQQPAWVLRNPKDFMHAILEKFIELVTKININNEILETITQAVLCLFTAQTALADQIPGLGHIPAIFKSMDSQNTAIPKSAIQVIHVLTNSNICVRSMAATNDGISYMIKAMEARPDVIGLACEALHNMFNKNHTELVAQAVKFQLVQYLLAILDSPLQTVENPAATKAQIVMALKSMIKDLIHGEEVNQILEASSVWSSYRDQKHDLFISDRPIAGYLTGSVGTAGYLTMGPGNPTNISSVPPPVENKNINGTS
ncbi:hypothetical protein QZH41_012074 [Actinostola sp. cb2023]|nr:hypothetical protein QZH41_012074 [Actinostola sp. cb2023]